MEKEWGLRGAACQTAWEKVTSVCACVWKALYVKEQNTVKRYLPSTRTFKGFNSFGKKYTSSRVTEEDKL